MTDSTPRRHHYVPRFLSRQFAFDPGRKRVVLYRRGGDGKEAGVTHVGVERDFHGTADDAALEREIGTKYENRLAPVVERLSRGGEIGDDRDQVVELLAHIMVRTAHLRYGLSDAGRQAVEAVSSLTESPEFEDHTRREAGHRAEDELRKLGLDPNMVVGGGVTLADLLRRQVQGMDLGFLRPLLEEVMGRLDLKEIAKASHVRALSDPAHLDRWKEWLDAMAFSVERREVDTWVLGDMGPVGYRERDGAFGLPILLKPEMDAVLMPIGPRALLIGRRGAALARIEDEALLVATASRTRDFFVARTRTERHRRLAEHIGSRAELMTRAGWEELAMKIRSEFEENA